MSLFTNPFGQEQTNRQVWSQDAVVQAFAGASGWIDASEQLLVTRLLVEADHPDVLDVGVGGGRTVPLLAPGGGRYTAIDYLPEMVAASRRRFPGVDIRDGDARQLEFDDATFDLVLFSINGLDAMGHDDRGRAVAEIRRVLRPGGQLLFSTHNLHGPGPLERPWSLPPLHFREPRSSVRRLVHRVTHARRARRNFRALQSHRDAGDGWSIAHSGAHDFGIVVHYTTIPAMTRELRQAGFEGPIEVWDDVRGIKLGAGRESARQPWYINVVARVSDPAG